MPQDRGGHCGPAWPHDAARACCKGQQIAERQGSGIESAIGRHPPGLRRRLRLRRGVERDLRTRPEPRQGRHPDLRHHGQAATGWFLPLSGQRHRRRVRSARADRGRSPPREVQPIQGPRGRRGAVPPGREQPAQAGSSWAGQPPSGMQIHSITVYPGKPIIYSNPGGLPSNGQMLTHMIDVSNPARPKIVGTFSPQGPPTGCHDFSFHFDKRGKFGICAGLGGRRSGMSQIRWPRRSCRRSTTR
jgi:hypothetical protein